MFKKKGSSPYIIAGPCSAETEEQVMDTAIALKKIDRVQLYRAGIWKPRTRPDSFEGVGKKGLPWLSRVSQELGIPVTVEVAKASHVEKCLQHKIDVLWIGARTSVNPFIVQEISDALKGVDIPVMVKNPINPDLSLWLGSVERIEKAGVQHVCGIHRGFSFVGEKRFRNRPQWQIPLEFKRQRPDLALINDPSHICGRRDILQTVAQKAMDLNFDGLMIESHIDPDSAWSDAAQQITPEALEKLLNGLVLREDFEDDQPMQSQLEYLRREIDHLDDEIIHLLANRMNISRQIGVYKRDTNMTILQRKRWNDIIERCTAQAHSNQLREEFLKNLISVIHDESIDQQEEIFREEENTVKD